MVLIISYALDRKKQFFRTVAPEVSPDIIPLDIYFWGMVKTRFIKQGLEIEMSFVRNVEELNNIFD